MLRDHQTKRLFPRRADKQIHDLKVVLGITPKARQYRAIAGEPREFGALFAVTENQDSRVRQVRVEEGPNQTIPSLAPDQLPDATNDELGLANPQFAAQRLALVCTQTPVGPDNVGT